LPAGRIAYAIALISACLPCAVVSGVHAQEMEPRSYSNAPVGMNFLITGYAQTKGGMAFDTSLSGCRSTSMALPRSP
jgi:hypothetical protein